MKIVVHDSLNLQEFEEAWELMVEKFTLYNNVWIKDVYDMRRRWVPGYWRDSFWVDMSSTQRNEGMNFFFKGHMSLNSGLKRFINLFEMALARKVEKEKIMNANTMERPHKCGKTILVEINK